MSHRNFVIALSVIGVFLAASIGVIIYIWNTTHEGDVSTPQQVEAPLTTEQLAENAFATGSAAVPASQIRPIDYEPILDATYWNDEFPYQTQSFLVQRDTGPKKDYLELYPYLNTIFAGSRFAEGYYSPLPHPYAIVNVKETPRLTPDHNAACFSCKTPDYVIMEARNPEATWATNFHEVSNQMTNAITCYDCHRNEPGRGLGGDGLDGGFTGSVRSHFSIWYEETRGSTASCAQCHVEYYFDQTTHQVNLPPGPTDPSIIFAYYNALGLVDHTNPNTGTEHIKVQHPEYQHFAGSVHQQEGMTCVDCHMVRSTPDGAGGFLTNHTIQSPSQSEEILQSCISCHPGSTNDVRQLITDTQTTANARRDDLGNRLAVFMDDFAAAQQAGTLSDTQITVLRSMEREAVFFFDWVFSENGNGVHNLEGHTIWLDRVEEVLSNAQPMLE